jgi:hypothetical protein
VDVGRPFELCGIRMAGSDVTSLELLELLLRAELVGLESVSNENHTYKAG